MKATSLYKITENISLPVGIRDERSFLCLMKTELNKSNIFFHLSFPAQCYYHLSFLQTHRVGYVLALFKEFQ